MEKLTQKITKYPIYRLKPWETQEIDEFTLKSLGYLKANNKFDPNDTRTMKARKSDTFLGAIGEVGFYWLLKEEYRKANKKWGLQDGRYTSAQDFVISGKERDYSIDIKTTMISDYIRGPLECNFCWSWASANTKKNAKIPFCDYYIQMLYFPEKEEIMYIGALSKDRIMEYEEKKRKWDLVRKGKNGFYGIIFYENMDKTNDFLWCIDDQYKKIIEL